MKPRAPLSKFEKQVQELVEGTFGRLLGGQIEPQAIAIKLARALEESSYNSDGQIANTFQVYIHPADFGFIAQNFPEIEHALANYLVQLAGKANLPLTDLPTVSLADDDLLQQQQIRVVATYDPSRDSTNTRLHRRRLLDEAVREAIATIDAFLVINGEQHVPLDLPMITLGRRVDNDIIIDSPTVSRKHAQIRWRYNHFIIYDMGSRAGVRVNGTKVRECVLQPGDVIQMSSTTLVYGEGMTRRMAPIRSDADVDEPTRVIPKTLSNPPPSDSISDIPSLPDEN